ncbi:5-cytosine rRNA methyltransferase NSUN4-like [Amphiura filiformis]|uniref:5-cytosine rRNA methyltransferase NSUN4-like n=1 Tax=Amphiura filiformis TaxID=82378 RepID=UPI003B214A98
MICLRTAFNNRLQRLAATKTQCLLVPRRWKKTKSKKKKYTKPGTQNRSDPTVLALRYFDETYRAHFGGLWPIIRLGLLSPHKHGALLNNYSARADSIEVQRLRQFGAVDIVEEAAKEIGPSDVHSTESHSVKDNDLIQENDAPLKGIQEMRRVASMQANYQGFDQLDSLSTSTSRDDKETEPKETPPHLVESEEGQSEEEKKWWEDQYIIAPGYEAKMESLIQGGEFDNRQSRTLVQPASNISIINAPIKMNPNLRCYVHQDEGNIKRFPRVKSDSTSGLLTYYAMDAASVLPVLALDLRMDETVLDLCAAPGGKSVAMLQTMYLGGLESNEPNKSRRQRLRSVFNSYVPASMMDSGVVNVSGEDGQELGDLQPNSYDKVLVDVPCTTDRQSALVPTNNIFNLYRVKERQNLPKLQRNLLCSALQAVKPGGDVVYSTCTLSRLQNDDVVENAISTCRSQYKIQANVVDLSPLTSALDKVFNFWKECTYGQLVLPGLKRNFGPMYFCKLRRIK